MAEGACKICGGLHSTGECSAEAKGEKQPDIIKCSEDGKHSIALSHEEGKDVVIIDGKRDEYPWHKGVHGERQHNIVDVSISRNGEHVGLTRQTKEGEFIILLDRKPAFKFRGLDIQEASAQDRYTKPSWSLASELAVSDDGKHWACIARDANSDRFGNEEKFHVSPSDLPQDGWSVVVDGETITRPVRTPGKLKFSADGSSFKFESGTSDKDELGGKKAGAFEGKLIGGQWGVREKKI